MLAKKYFSGHFERRVADSPRLVIPPFLSDPSNSGGFVGSVKEWPLCMATYLTRQEYIINSTVFMQNLATYG